MKKDSKKRGTQLQAMLLAKQMADAFRKELPQELQKDLVLKEIIDGGFSITIASKLGCLQDQLGNISIMDLVLKYFLPIARVIKKAPPELLEESGIKSGEEFTVFDILVFLFAECLNERIQIVDGRKADNVGTLVSVVEEFLDEMIKMAEADRPDTDGKVKPNKETFH